MTGRLHYQPVAGNLFRLTERRTSGGSPVQIRVTVWNEFRHERQDPQVKAVYPEGIHAAIAAGLRPYPEFEVQTAVLDDPDQGLSTAVLERTDVLIWWGHMHHDQVRDEAVSRVHRRVMEGMGLIVLHSAHHSKIFTRLVGTTCNLRWREDGLRERVWVVEPAHPIAEGLDHCFELEHEEMYGEPFEIPAPDTLVLISWFRGGEVFRSGCCYHRGRGKIFYFRPGHETFPTYFDPNVRKVISNGVRWAATAGGPRAIQCNPEPLELIN